MCHMEIFIYSFMHVDATQPGDREGRNSDPSPPPGPAGEPFDLGDRGEANFVFRG